MAKKSLDASTIDKRLTDKLISRGEFNHSDLDAALKKLPDMEEMADNIADVVYRNTEEAEASEDAAE